MEKENFNIPMTVFEAVDTVIVYVSKQILTDKVDSAEGMTNALAKLIEARAKLNDF
jgi:hypothetical protein